MAVGVVGVAVVVGPSSALLWSRRCCRRRTARRAPSLASSQTADGCDGSAGGGGLRRGRTSRRRSRHAADPSRISPKPRTMRPDRRVTRGMRSRLIIQARGTGSKRRNARRRASSCRYAMGLYTSAHLRPVARSALVPGPSSFPRTNAAAGVGSDAAFRKLSDSVLTRVLARSCCAGAVSRAGCRGGGSAGRR